MNVYYCNTGKVLLFSCEVSHQWISQASGFDSGKATKAASAFTNVFQDLGIFYFARYTMYVALSHLWYKQFVFVLIL